MVTATREGKKITVVFDDAQGLVAELMGVLEQHIKFDANKGNYEDLRLEVDAYLALESAIDSVEVTEHEREVDAYVRMQLG